MPKRKADIGRKTRKAKKVATLRQKQQAETTTTPPLPGTSTNHTIGCVPATTLQTVQGTPLSVTTLSQPLISHSNIQSVSTSRTMSAPQTQSLPVMPSTMPQTFPPSPALTLSTQSLSLASQLIPHSVPAVSTLVSHSILPNVPANPGFTLAAQFLPLPSQSIMHSVPSVSTLASQSTVQNISQTPNVGTVLSVTPVSSYSTLHSVLDTRTLSTVSTHNPDLTTEIDYPSKLKNALKSKTKLACFEDTTLFEENAYPSKLIEHKITSLFQSPKCKLCKAYKFPGEKPTLCCQNGRVNGIKIPEITHTMKDLYANNDFLNNIRSYNNAFAMASIACKEITLPGFSPTVKIQGKVYHRIGSLQNQDQQPPKFAQIYFNDNQSACRQLHSPNLKIEIMDKIQAYIEKENPYVQSFKFANDFSSDHDQFQIVLNADKKPSHEHKRKYNLPSASEVSVILPGEQINNRDIVIQTKDGQLRNISELHRSYDPLHYVLLLPFGTDGYHLDIKNTENKSISALQFYRYQLQVNNFI